MTENLSKTVSQYIGPNGPDPAELTLCVHCGLCLNYCPTYLELGTEPDSPRGRLQLMRALDEGRVDASPRVQLHFDRCLQCRACETACPSNVPYGRLMEATRANFFERRPKSLRQRLLWGLVMRRIFPYPRRLKFLLSGLRWYQKCGFQNLIRRTGILWRISTKLASIEALTPNATRPFFHPRDIYSYSSSTTTKTSAALLTGCVMPFIYGDTHRATARVLSRNGVRLVAAEKQVCCGALHAHSGDIETAKKLARKNIDVFLASEPDAIVVNSAGCGSHMKEISHMLRDDPEYASKAAYFSSLVSDIHEYLVKINFEPPKGVIQRSITYQDSCHLVHAQQITEAPREILRSIPGLDLREMEHPDRCCGSAGIYSLAQSELSRDLLKSKMTEINATSAEQVCSANPGCMVQLDAGLRLFGDRKTEKTERTLHTIELLDESYRNAEGTQYADKV